jgi:dolichol-phosphate mannosyltransferase
MKEKVLIFGSGGFIGKNLAFGLTDLGYEIIAPSRYQCDVTDFNQVSYICGHRPKIIYYFSAYGSHNWEKDVLRTHSVNFTGLLNVLLASKFYEPKIIHAGTSLELYPPKDHYTASKINANNLLKLWNLENKTNHVNLQLFSVYGSGMDERLLIPTLIREGKQGKWPPMANKNLEHDFVHIDDVVNACIMAAESPAGDYQVGTGESITLQGVTYVAQYMLKIPQKSNILHFDNRENRIYDRLTWKADKKHFIEGWKPAINFEEGFSRLIRS